MIECKHWAQDLNLHDNQLIRYFNVSKAKFGVLTNGVIYRFYTDLEEVNKMDTKPFLEVNLLEIKESQIDELKKFHKSYFDIENVLSTASELKYMRELKAEISSEFENPSVDFVKLIGKRIISGTFTAKIQEQFTPLLKRAIHSHINDIISNRLKSAIKEEDANPVVAKQSAEEENDKVEGKKNNIVTTAEEMEGFLIVKAIAREVIAPERITHRDTLSYFGVLVDDNNRKPICRLHFNTSQKYIGIFDEEKKETKYKIECLDDIFNYAAELRAAASLY